MQPMMKQYNGIYLCFIDSTWFCTSSGRNKEKTVPTIEFDTKEETFYIPQKSTQSCRYATKVMYMGIIHPPTKLPNIVEIPHGLQNGKTGMHRLSKKIDEEYKKLKNCTMW